MKKTFPLSVAFAFATCAALVACGGGGGGGGGGTPPTSAPISTPTIAPTAQSTTAAVNGTATTLGFGAVSNGTSTVISSGTVILPAVSAVTSAGVVMTANLPAGVAIPTARNMRGRFTLGVPNVPIAYFQITVSSTVTTTNSPGFTVVLPSSVSVSSGSAYVVMLPGSGTWQEVAGPIAAANSMTFAPQVLNPSFKLAKGVTYTFAIVTTANLTIATPVPTAAPTGATTLAPGSDATLPPQTNTHGWTPSQVASMLQFPVQNGYNGTGQTVVIIGDYQPLATDVSAYLTANGITSVGANFTTVPINGFTAPGTDTDSQAEATLDTETVAGLAPGANIEFYAMPDLTGPSFVLAYMHLTNDAQATVMSVSFGGCEYQGYSDTTQDPILATAAAQGVTMFASSGDQGNECYGPDQLGASPAPSYAPGVSYPASDPNVVGVGGQETYASAGDASTQPSGHSLTTQIAWNDYFFSGPGGVGHAQGASGGGVSSLFTPPPYQNGLLGAASTTLRNVPDIAMPAEAVSVYLKGAWATYGGTSWSAPLAAAMTATLNQACGGSMIAPAGTNPVARFYTAYSRTSANFLDIITGTNQFGASSPYYSAGPGYDNVSGLGVPYGNYLAGSLCPGSVPSARRGIAVTHGTAALANDAYGEARDTSLGFVPHQGVDAGERGSAPVTVVIAMRVTPTLATDEANVVASLQAAGFTITTRFANHIGIAASAPATTVERYFQTSIHDVNQGEHGTRYANTTPVVLPAAIARVTRSAIVDDLVIARWLHHRMVPLGKN